MEGYGNLVLVLLMLDLPSTALCSNTSYLRPLDRSQTSLVAGTYIRATFSNPNVKKAVIQAISTYGGALLVKKLLWETNKTPGPPVILKRMLPVFNGLMTSKRGPEVVKLLIKAIVGTFVFDPRDGREMLLEEMKLRNYNGKETSIGIDKFFLDNSESVLEGLFDAKLPEDSSAVKFMHLFSDKWKLMQIMKLAQLGGQVDQAISPPSETLSTLPHNRKKAMFIAGGKASAKAANGLGVNKIIVSFAKQMREAINLRLTRNRYCEEHSSKFEFPDLLVKNKEYVNLAVDHTIRRIQTAEMASTLKRLVVESLTHPTIDQVYSKLQYMVNKSVEISSIPTKKHPAVRRQSGKVAKTSRAKLRQDKEIKEILQQMIRRIAQSWTEGELGSLLSHTLLDVLTSSKLEQLVILATKVNIGDHSNLLREFSNFSGSADGMTSLFENVKAKLGNDSIEFIRENFMNYLIATDEEVSSGVTNLGEVIASLEGKIVTIT